MCGKPRGAEIPLKYPYCDEHWQARFSSAVAARRALVAERQAARKQRI